jgi:hypothetical protein
MEKYRKESTNKSELFELSQTRDLALKEFHDKSVLSNASNFLEFVYKDKYINFDISFPGQNVKRVFGLKNNSSHKMSIDIKFSYGDLKNNFESIIENFKNFEKDITNSQNLYSCFSFQEDYLNNMKITLRPYETETIDLNLITPFVKNKQDLFSMMEIHSERDNILNIPIMGYIDVPKLVCLCDIKGGSVPMINLKLEVKSKGQKFKIHFKNLSLLDMDLDIIIERKFNDNSFKINGNFYQCQFYCFPNTLTINSHNTTSIDLIAKVTKASEENINNMSLTNRIRKVLIAKVKNANIFYTFFIESIFN